MTELSNRHYPKAIVPSHYSKRTIENMPYDEPCYISPDYEEMFDLPKFFVDEDDHLRVVAGEEIDLANFQPKQNPLGRIGIVRTCLIGADGITSAYAADLRFPGSHQLDRYANMRGSMSDQESFMTATEMLEESIRFDGLIVAEADTECNKDTIPTGALCGDERLHPALKRLRKFGNKGVREYFAAEERRKKSEQSKKKRTKSKQ